MKRIVTKNVLDIVKLQGRELWLRKKSGGSRKKKKKLLVKSEGFLGRGPVCQIDKKTSVSEEASAN